MKHNILPPPPFDFKKFLYRLVCTFHILTFYLLKKREIIRVDVNRRREYRIYGYADDFTTFFCQVLCRDKEFRNVFYMRLNNKVLEAFLGLILPPLKDMDLEHNPNIGSGFVLIHGHGTIINRFSKIGNNCTIYHGVTIGGTGGMPPIIGDNVLIGCGALVLGEIKIGNNVKIGAGTVVMKDVPDNVTVVGNPARIINRRI